MTDRDSLMELYDIIKAATTGMDLPLTAAALPYIRGNFFSDYDIYYRRRLSVCRMLIDLHLTVEPEQLDILLAATLANHMPGDNCPEDMDAEFQRLYAGQPLIWEVLSVLRQMDYSNRAYYQELIHYPYPLIIRLTERSVLLEKLYEWEPVDALKYIRETREEFFPMCIYAKEHYPEFLGAASILHEKMRNLTTVNEALLGRFVETENAIRDEILSLKEENAVIRAMIADLSAR